MIDLRKDCGAQGDVHVDDETGALVGTDDYPAFARALKMRGDVIVPPGEYYSTRSLLIDETRTIVFEDGALLRFTVPGLGVRVRHALETRGKSGGNRSRLINVHTTCGRLPIATAARSHDYHVGDRIHPDGFEFGSPLHFICTQQGTTAADGPTWKRIDAQSNVIDEGFGWSFDPSVFIFDGTCVFRLEDWSAFSVSAPDVLLDRCVSTEFGGCGVYAYGYSGRSVADGLTVRECSFVGGQAGLFFNGDDANTCTIESTAIELVTSVGVWDSPFFSNRFESVRVITARKSFVSDGGAAQSVFEACYSENCGDEIDPGGYPLIKRPNVWLNGEPGLFDPRSTAERRNGEMWEGGIVTRGATDNPLVSVLGGPVGAHTLRRQDDRAPLIIDVVGDAIAARWDSRADETPLELTCERSVRGPYRIGFPMGFSVGRDAGGLHPIKTVAFHHAPTRSDAPYLNTYLWSPGDRIHNSLPAINQPSGWVCVRKCGWGGGRHSGAEWSADVPLCIGQGIEPSTSNGLVYQAVRFELSVGDGWAPYDAEMLAMGDEPAWQTSGVTTAFVDTADGQVRIALEAWGIVGDSTCFGKLPDVEAL